MDNRVTPAVVATDGRLGARGEKLLAAVAAVLFLAALFLGWRAYFYAEEGDPVASAMKTFEKQNDLIVLAYRFQVDADATITGPMGVSMLDRRQVVIVPATVEYRVRLGEIERSDLAWNAETKVLSIELPPLRISPPNIDEKSARSFTNGIWVSREDAAALARKNSQIAERKAAEYAKDPEVLGLARAAAREAVERNLALAVSATGVEAAVEVRFEGES